MVPSCMRRALLCLPLLALTQCAPAIPTEYEMSFEEANARADERQNGTYETGSVKELNEAFLQATV